jgi:CubicO group peptidase (beta-lactamase class C family)
MRLVFAIVALCAALSQVASAESAPDTSAAPLEGLWLAEVSQPVLQGDLVITRRGDAWTAAIAGRHPSVAVHDGELSFALAQGQGSFRGAALGQDIRGVWTQPPTLSGQGYATPLTLRRSGRATWRGDVAPLDQRFHLYLRVFRDADGRWLGAFRNPEANFNGGASRFVVRLSGDAVRFSVPGDSAAHDATLLRGPDRLRLHWPPFSDEIELTRATPAQAATFYPRAPGSPAYVYTAPPSIADGWRTARARDVGMDEGALAAAVQRIIDVDPSSRRPSLIHSLLVAHRGRLVLEEYFYGFDRDTPHDVRSAAKTFGSIMLGAAMREGAHISAETRIYPLLAGMGPFANPDARKARVTLAHLMTESSGLACNDYDENSPGAEGNMQGQSTQPNWWRYTLDLPMAHEPGERYAYCSGNTNLVGAALRVATNTPVVDYFDRAIARSLQFGPYHWNLMPSGESYLGGGVQMRPRDLLKIGQLYLDGGVWNGRRVVSRAWATLSTSALQPINEQTTGLDAATFGNSYTRGADGYAWHRYGVRVGDRLVDEYEANGNGGQLLIVVPDHDLVVVFTGGNFGQGGIWIPWRNEIVGGQIIPAIGR